MEISFEKRDTFKVSGFAVETNLDSASEDVGLLWENYEKKLLDLANGNSPLYGLMWYTKDYNYFYLLGIENNNEFNTETIKNIKNIKNSNINSNNNNSNSNSSGSNSNNIDNNEKYSKNSDKFFSVEISSACFMIANLPKEMDAFEGWTQFFEVEIPNLGYVPDKEHGKYFERYENNICNLCTPVKRAD